MSLVNDTVLERINTLVVVTNKDGKIEYVSPSVKRILGYDPKELLGDGWWALTRDNSKERRKMKEFVRYQLDQTPLTETTPQERLLKTAGGGEKWILWNTSRGLFNKLIAIGHDITDRKKAEEQLQQKHRELEQQNRDILASIRYARRIQESLLSDTQKLQAFHDHFVLYLPQAEVSGDYYFFHQRGSKTFVVAVDCTGHGVPGALMTMIAHSILKEVLVKKALDDPAEMLHALDEELALELHHEGRENTDGMDVAIAVLDREMHTISYAGAFRPMLRVRENVIEEFAPNRFPIGFYGDAEKTFVTRTEPVLPGDTFYLFTDGYCDQFGGEQKKKFNRVRFKELLLSVQTMPLAEQASFLKYALRNWRQEEPQVDDVLVIGLRV